MISSTLSLALESGACYLHDMPAEPYKILCLDDEDSLREALVSFLQAHGFDAHGMCSKAEGLAWIAENQPDLVITDISSYGLDGIGFLGILRSRPETRNIKVMVLTGRNELQIAIEVHALGAIDFMSKAFDEKDLLEAIERALSAPFVYEAPSS